MSDGCVCVLEFYAEFKKKISRKISKFDCKKRLMQIENIDGPFRTLILPAGKKFPKTYYFAYPKILRSILADNNIWVFSIQLIYSVDNKKESSFYSI